MAATPENTLMPREFEVCKLLTQGMSNAEIGIEIGVDRNSVAHTFCRAMTKAGTDNRVMLALWFVRKFSSEAAIVEGYRDACVYAVQSRQSGRLRRQSITRDLGK
jgi:DNA-binding CsgD family transcriptional regulator